MYKQNHIVSKFADKWLQAWVLQVFIFFWTRPILIIIQHTVQKIKLHIRLSHTSKCIHTPYKYVELAFEILACNCFMY